MIKENEVLIHQTAVVEPGAELDEGVQVGPFALIEKSARVGKGTRIGARVTIEGFTTIGADCEIFTGAVVGSPTQDKKFAGGKSYLYIGDRNKIREYVTINPGTDDGSETRIGNDNLLMAYAHVAHDCVVGDHVTLANNATLAGHVILGNRAIIGGLSAVHQFVRIGEHVIVGGCSKVVQDTPPFIMVDGHPAKSFSINSVGLDRAGFTAAQKLDLKKAFKIVFRSGLSLKSSIKRLEEQYSDHIVIARLLDFLRNSDKGICK